MSGTIVFAAPAEGPLVEVGSVRNSWGSAARVWFSVSRKIYGDESYWMVRRDAASQEAFWNLRDDGRLTDCEREVFRWTFDKAICRRRNFRRLAEAMRNFAQAHPSSGACNLGALASLLDQAAGENALEFQPEYMAWQQTTVSECPWLMSDGDDGGSMYDPSRGDDHFLLFEVDT